MVEVAELISEADWDLGARCEVEAQVQGCACWDGEMIEEGGICRKLVDGDPLQVFQEHHSAGGNAEMAGGRIAERNFPEERCALEKGE